jgi:Xaa-Pro aminopeptidase
LWQLRSVLTDMELERVRTACRIGGDAFTQGAQVIRAGLNEAQVAATFQAGLLQEGKSSRSVRRAGGWAWCMSGPNAAEAGAAFARTRHRAIAPGDLVLVHANSYADGFWTDITRTFCVGEMDERKGSLYAAVRESFAAAVGTIKAGVTGAAVDRAARGVLEARGLAGAFKHGTGHGVGFGAISHWDKPRLHPLSQDVLETGMVFNVEPAVYIEGYGGLRHCSMIAVTPQGVEVLTPFQSELPDLICGK